MELYNIVVLLDIKDMLNGIDIRMFVKRNANFVIAKCILILV